MVMSMQNDSMKKSLTLTRVVDGPRDLVWKVWTDPKHVARWFGPNGFDTRVREWDARPDGAIYLVMSGMGMEHPMSGIFHEVVKPERLVFTATPEDVGGNKLLAQRTIVTFEAEGGKTKVTVQADAVGLAPVAAQMLAGMEPGWSQTLDRMVSDAVQTKG
jgi:uncharacterized protein YndB with AHSA1/START domain